MAPHEQNPAASPEAGGQGDSRSWALAVAALTLAALVLRARGIHESLFADEVYSYRIVANYGLLHIVGQVHDTAITPPLHYLLARVAVEFGDARTWIRVPSILLGAATVPLVYLLGVRTLNRRAGLFAAAVAAISPFAVFYGTEARAYATLMFFVVLSTLALLIALDTGRRRWLVLYAASATLVLYAHYSGVFVVAAQGIWALVAHRERFRELLIANVAIALAYLPWVPSFLYQGDEHPPEQISLVSPVTLRSFKDAMLATFPGRPFVDLDVVPGNAALVVISVALALAAAALAFDLLRRRAPAAGAPRTDRLVLLVLVGVATPIGITVYSLAETSLFGPRNMAASLPALWLLLGWLLTASGRVTAAVAGGLVVASLAVGTATSLSDDYRRPPYREVAAAIDQRATRCEPVVEVLWLNPMNALSKALEPQLKAAHPVSRIAPSDEAGWRLAARSRKLFVVAPQVLSLKGESWASHLGPGYTLRYRRVFRGAIDVAVFEYARSGGPAGPARLVSGSGGEAIDLPGGRRLPVGENEGGGFVEVVNNIKELLQVQGWTIDAQGGRRTRAVMTFDRSGCLILSGHPTQVREDVAADHGARYRRSGYVMRAVPGDAESLAQPGVLRTFGLSKTGAWELPPGGQAYPDAR
jgi:4-amino-4-deoxy-L-arabinose transferase-like glycosyltransferase